MRIQTFLGKLAGKSAYLLLSKLGRGTTLPGKIALFFDKHILKSLVKDYEIIVITGTNGKTVTTALTVAILKKAFGNLVTNTSGANMLTGITTTFLAAKKSMGKKQIAVLEIDEASLAKVTEFLTPILIVFTNIFRDQMDRYGEIYTTYQMIVDGAAKAPFATILANGDSPLFHGQKTINPIRYYGFDTEKHEPRLAHYNTEGILCPHCHHILQYRLNTYANLGDYTCLHCGFERPHLDYRLTELKQLTTTSSSFVIDGQEYTIHIGGLYNIYNALAAVSVAEYMGVDPVLIRHGFDTSQAVFGRQETFTLGQTECTLVLIKNPVGANQAIEMMNLASYPFQLAVLLNANYADGIDTSWIWDANFEQLQHMTIPQVLVGGVRATEMARRIRVAGVPENRLKEIPQLADLIQELANSSHQKTYILATYTAMLEIRELLAQRHIIEKEMS